MSVYDFLDEAIEREWEDGAEIALELNVLTECMWSGELRYTPEPNRKDGPDRSFVFYAGGGQTPDQITQRLLSDFNAWKNGR